MDDHWDSYQNKDEFHHEIGKLVIPGLKGILANPPPLWHTI